MYRARDRLRGETFERRVHRLNMRGEVLMKAIVGQVVGQRSNCVDIGANQGVFVGAMIEAAPLGCHYAVEPVPDLAEELRRRYPMVRVRQAAVGALPGRAEFFHVVTNAFWSGSHRAHYLGRPEEWPAGRPDTLTVFGGRTGVRRRRPALTFLTRRATLNRTRAILDTFAKGNSDYMIWLSLTKYRNHIFNPLRYHRWFVRYTMLRAWRFAWKRILWGDRYTLWAPVPTIATHIESTCLSPTVDWPAVFRCELEASETEIGGRTG